MGSLPLCTMCFISEMFVFFPFSAFCLTLTPLSVLFFLHLFLYFLLFHAASFSFYCLYSNPSFCLSTSIEIISQTLPTRLSVCLSACLSACLSVRLSVWKRKTASFVVYSDASYDHPYCTLFLAMYFLPNPVEPNLIGPYQSIFSFTNSRDAPIFETR